MIEFSYRPHWTLLILAAIILAGLLAWSYRSARTRSSSHARWILPALRFVGLVVLFVCLMDPHRIEHVKHFLPGRIAVLMDNSQSMSWPENETGGSRLDIAKRWAADRLKLPPNYRADVYAFNTNVQEVSNIDAVAATTSETHITAALEQLLLSNAQEPPSSVVLISDGADTSSKAPANMAKQYRERSIPIHTLAVGSSNEPPDIVLEHVTANSALPGKTKATVAIQLRAPGFKNKTVPVQVLQGGQVLADHRTMLTGESQRLELEFSPIGTGFQTFLLKIEPQDNERLANNNEREFGMTIADATLRVLYMEASAGEPDYPGVFYLKHALEEDPSIQVTTLYSEKTGTPRALYNQVAYVDPKRGDKIYRLQNETLGCPKKLEDFLQYHVIINSDIPKYNFSPEQLHYMERFVTEFGGGFAMIGGHTAFGAGGYNETVIDRIIPVAMDVERDVMDRPFQFVLTDVAWAHPIMQLDTSKAGLRDIWTEKLPIVRGFNRVDRAKPGAVVLLEHPDMRTQFGPCVIMAVQEIGKGRSMAFTSDANGWWGELFDTIWGEPINPNQPLSAANCDLRYYRQFWRNTVRWLAARKFQQPDNFVRLTLSDISPRPGSSFFVPVQVTNRRGEAISDASVALNIRSQNGEAVIEEASFDESRNRFLARVKVKDAGRYMVEATAKLPDGKTIQDQQLLTVEVSSRELLEVRANPQLLSEIARSSGGTELFLKKSTEEILPALAGAKPIRIETRKTPIWDRGWWLVILLAILTVEWTLRRKFGFA